MIDFELKIILKEVLLEKKENAIVICYLCIVKLCCYFSSVVARLLINDNNSFALSF
jgi:hypothetical protein